MPARPLVSIRELYLLAAEAACHPKTVARVLAGGSVQPGSRAAVLAAARKLAYARVVDLLEDGVPYRPGLNVRAT